ncbi:MAG: hypothetical protein LAQ69_13390 [Acidobacteriia bacterium]|nr:hypothetical protein [Terriglobia bacterium]
MNLSLTADEEARLVAQAVARGTTPEALVREAIEPILSAAAENPSQTDEGTPRERRPIWDVLLENMKGVPPEDLAALPTDGASQIDHYVYGLPKRAE